MVQYASRAMGDWLRIEVESLKDRISKLESKQTLETITKATKPKSEIKE